MRHDTVSAVALLGAAAILAMPLGGCRFERAENPTASADSTAVARALALSAVPRIAPGTSADLRVDAGRIGGAFASTFERELAPAIAYVRRSGTPDAFVILTVDSLTMALDSATAVVSDSSPSSANTLRVRMVPRPEGGWRVVSQEVLRHVDIRPVLSPPSELRSSRP